MKKISFNIPFTGDEVEATLEITGKKVRTIIRIALIALATLPLWILPVLLTVVTTAICRVMDGNNV